MPETRSYTSAIEGPLPDPVTFTLDGVTYTCRELGPLELSEIARLQGRPADSPEAIGFMAEFFHTLLGNDQYRDFRSRCADFETGVQTFIGIIEGVFMDFTARPTPPLSDSSPGQRITETSSSDALSSRVIARLDGRPDLQAAVSRAQRSSD
jgi:hypothetical protein